MTQRSEESANYETIAQALKNHKQEHLLHYFNDLNTKEQEALLEHLTQQDWPMLDMLIKRYVNEQSVSVDHYDISPAPFFALEPSASLEPKYEEAKVLGQKLLREGKVAAFTVAGGQGSRLGWDAPKGTFPATPIHKKSLFQVFAESIKKASLDYGRAVPWYIMTSPMNDADTKAFFKKHEYFDLNPSDIMFFPQGTLPSFDTKGKILLKNKAELALSPDGHGGSFKALQKSGALVDMKKRGVAFISYFQVDNPNIKIIDPLFIGLHALEGADMSAKMLPKAEAKEKVGNFCLVGGKLGVIEYSDMPDELAESTNDKGELLYNAGSIAIHMLSVAFAESITDDPDSLPYHRANKKVAHLDIPTGQQMEPTEPNAIKLERFIFDAMPLAENAFILETDRVEEFAPIKNAEGTDSPASSQALQIERAARWLEQNGVNVPRKADGSVDAIIEISPLTASCVQDLAKLELQIKAGDELSL